jgi:DNA-binding transcriptional ArsR family regulator
MLQPAIADTIFHALSNTTRRQILEQLALGPATVSDLAAPFDMKLPSFVQHLSVLERSHLVKKEGRVRTYEISPEQFQIAETWLSERRQAWESRFNRFDAYVHQLNAKEKETK